jgi:hypothetical protein
VAPPLWTVTVGFSGHGKTTYLNALTLSIENLARRLPGVHYRYLDERSLEKVRAIRATAFGRKQPKQTEEEDALLVEVKQFPQVPDHSLILHDVRGELFEMLDKAHQAVPALCEVETVWFLASLSDLDMQQDKGLTLSDLFASYHAAMERLQARLDNRTIIFVLTKADRHDFPREIDDYLARDPFQAITIPNAVVDAAPDFSLDEYLDELDGVSQILEQYTVDVIPGGAQLVNSIRGWGVDLRFCVTSALGQSPEDNNILAAPAQRYRVLDPYFLTLRPNRSHSQTVNLSQPRQREQYHFALILDGSESCGPVFENELARRLWEELAKQGEVVTYFLGQQKPAARNRQKPPEGPARSPRQRLIGPILDRLAQDTRAVIVTTGSVRDLQDFVGPKWSRRLLVLSVGEYDEDMWPSSMHLRPGDSAHNVIDTLLNPDA